MSIVLSKQGTKFIEKNRFNDNESILPLIPKLPVWKYSRCMNINDWKYEANDDLDIMVNHISEYISNLNNELEDHEIIFNPNNVKEFLTIYLYKTSLNVKTNFYA